MANERFHDLVEQLQSHRIGRREFMQRAAALGLSASVIGAALRARGVTAQDATPAAGEPQQASEIGVPGVTHNTDTSKGMIRLYSSWPLGGASTQLGGDAVESIKMALADRGNAAGGFALEYTALDDGIAAKNGAWDAGKESENANKVINDPDAMVYIATYNSGAAQISIPILNKVPMAMISYANTAIGLTKKNPANAPGLPDSLYPSGKRNYMRVVPADDIQGSASANWAYNKLGSKKAYILHDNQIYGKGVATIFEQTFKQLGGESLGFDAFDPNAPSYEGLMNSIADKGPDLVYLGSIVNLNASKVLQDLRSVMSDDDVKFLGPDGLANQAFVDAAGDAAEGAYITFAGLPTDALGKKGGAGGDYVKRMTDKLGHTPDSYAVYAYETAVAVVQAIDKAGEKDRTKILDALFGTEGFNGLLGTWSFTETGDTTATTMSLNIVKDKVITFQEEIAAP